MAVSFRGLSHDYDEGFDATMAVMQPTDISLKVNNNSGNFVITGIENYTEDAIEIPLHVRLDQQRDVTFRIDGIENFTTNPTHIYLKDNSTMLYHDLINPISLNLPTGDYTDRFSITFRNSPLGIEDIVNASDFLITDDVTNITVISSNHLAINNVTIYNMLGQTLVTKNTLNSTVNLPVTIDNGQVLLITIALENGQTVTKKWIKK